MPFVYTYNRSNGTGNIKNANDCMSTGTIFLPIEYFTKEK